MGYTSLDDDDGYYDNYISRDLCGIGPVNQQDFTIQDAVNIGRSPKHKSKGHCWIYPLGCLYVSFSHPYLKFIQEKLLSSTNKGTHPIYTNLLVFELSPIKIHAIKSLHSSDVWGDIPEIVERIIHILETLSMNHLPRELKSLSKTVISRHTNTTEIFCLVLLIQCRASVVQLTPISLIFSTTFMVA